MEITGKTGIKFFLDENSYCETCPVSPLCYNLSCGELLCEKFNKLATIDDVKKAAIETIERLKQLIEDSGR